jgi:hypothetical protein
MNDDSTHTSRYPRSWSWAEDGKLEGGYVAFRTIETREGSVPALELKVRGTNEVVTVWLSAGVLRNELARELRKRPEHDFTPGELITIERGKRKQRSAAGYDYWPFTVTFEFAAKQRPLDVLAASKSEPAKPTNDNADDDIPF